MKTFFRIRLPLVYRSAFSIFCCIVLFPWHMYRQPMAGIDPSWVISINLAIKNSFVWGKDYIFSYGPLGYLSTGVCEYVSPWPLFFFSVLTWVNVCAIINKILKSIRDYQVIHLVTGLLCLLTLYDFLLIDVSSMLLLSCLFWLLYSLKYESLPAAVTAVGISVLMFFIKIDTGIAINLFLLFFYTYQWLFQKQRWWYILLFIINYTLLFYLCRLLRVDLYGYLAASIHVINAYNDAMYIPGNPFLVTIAIIVVFCFIITGIQNRKQIIQDKIQLFSYCFCLMALFLLFKHGFVRHQGFTFIQPPLTIIVLLFMSYFLRPEKLFFVRVLFCLLFPLAITAGIIQSVENINSRHPVLFSLKNKGMNLVWNAFFHKVYTPPPVKLAGIDSATLPYVLPPVIRKKIGNSTVDIIPHHVSTVYFNHLKYNPRPGIQSYANYDAFLDDKGALKYSSATAPDYIIYCAENKGLDAAIDNRYPFFDEPRTKMALLQYYVVVDSFDNQLLLQHRPVSKQILSGIVTTRVTRFNEVVPIPSSPGLQMMEVNIRYNLLGKLVRFFYQPPGLTVTFTLSDGSQHFFRAIKPILEEGVLVNRFITKNADVVRIIGGNIQNIPRISKICFKGNGWGFNPEIKLLTRYITLK